MFSLLLDNSWSRMDFRLFDFIINHFSFGEIYSFALKTLSGLFLVQSKEKEWTKSWIDLWKKTDFEYLAQHEIDVIFWQKKINLKKLIVENRTAIEQNHSTFVGMNCFKNIRVKRLKLPFVELWLKLIPLSAFRIYHSLDSEQASYCYDYQKLQREFPS